MKTADVRPGSTPLFGTASCPCTESRLPPVEGLLRDTGAPLRGASQLSSLLCSHETSIHKQIRALGMFWQSLEWGTLHTEPQKFPMKQLSSQH